MDIYWLEHYHHGRYQGRSFSCSPFPSVTSNKFLFDYNLPTPKLLEELQRKTIVDVAREDMYEYYIPKLWFSQSLDFY